MDFFHEEKNNINNDYNTKKYKLSTFRAVLSLVIYLFVMTFVGAISFFVLDDIPDFNQHYSETDILIETLFTKNAIGITDHDSFNSSFYEDSKEIDIVNLDGDYLLLASSGVFSNIEIENINEEFIKNIFELEEYYKNEYRVYRISPNNLNEEFFVNYNILDPVFEYKTNEVTKLNSLGAAIQNFSLYLILLVGLIIVTWQVIINDFLRLEKKNKPLQAGLIGVLLVYGGNIVGNMLTIILSALFKERVLESVNQLSIVSILTSKHAYIIIFTVVIMGPLVEEIIFRKTIFSFFNNKNVAIMVSSLAFGLIHVIGESSLGTMIIALIPYLIPGLIFGYIYAKNDENIVVPLISHIVLNAVSVILILLIN